ncbi:hypothetical protein FOA52_014034 [Chlamydomonas sp. UWO 241]|nr:hypothetical protein FOA52_014034 [Chlamydomonas sp. UWO 241]
MAVRPTAQQPNLMLPADTRNVPEYVPIVRAREGVSIESGMSMVPMRFEFVYEDVARELGVLAEDGVGAQRSLQLTGQL